MMPNKITIPNFDMHIVNEFNEVSDKLLDAFDVFMELNGKLYNTFKDYNYDNNRFINQEDVDTDFLFDLLYDGKLDYFDDGRHYYLEINFNALPEEITELLKLYQKYCVNDFGDIFDILYEKSHRENKKYENGFDALYYYLCTWFLMNSHYPDIEDSNVFVQKLVE